MDNPRSILITGASSGIGAALALDYAAPETRLWLSGRSHKRLEEITTQCRNTGISGAGPDGATIDTIFSINIGGVLNTVLPTLEAMQKHGAGQIAIMSSLASFRGLPGALAYSASKAAVRTWGEALRGRHKPDGIAVSVICPGFVVSRITDRNDFPMPLLMTADRAARIIRRGLARNKARIAFPCTM